MVRFERWPAVARRMVLLLCCLSLFPTPFVGGDFVLLSTRNLFGEESTRQQWINSAPTPVPTEDGGTTTKNTPPKQVFTITSQEVIENEFIVKFKSYLTVEQQTDVFLHVFGSPQGWQIVERPNPAFLRPSDFALVKLTGQDESTAAEPVFNADITEVQHNESETQPEQQQQQQQQQRRQSHLTETRFKDVLAHHVGVRGVFPHKKLVASLLTLEEGRARPWPWSSRKLKEDDFTDEGNNGAASEEGPGFNARKPLNAAAGGSTFSIPHMLNADHLWEKKFMGAGVRVGVFDTGLCEDTRFREVVERTNWTDEQTLDDGLGHGTFVAGVIASQDEECMGFAPDAELYVFRVFTNSKVSYTSWFLDAFNWAIFTGIDVLNLSIGGPDFMDQPFVEKVWEMSANNIIVVSAIGNDGPLYGTLNNPADQADVIGVGGIDFNERIAPFSSRGMTTWELPGGFGRVKPDLVAYGQAVSGPRLRSGCRTLSGTSVASPVVAGVVTLLASTVRSERVSDIVNPASMKQALVESAELIPDANIYEQGLGKLNLMGAYERLSTYTPRASAIPPSLDLTECPYMWPFCTQPMYYGALPVIFNLTVLNGMGVSGTFVSTPEWIPGRNGNRLELAFSYNSVIWPWSGHLGLHLRVSQRSHNWSGVAEGIVRFEVESYGPVSSGGTLRRSVVEVPLKARIAPTPAREKRVLWDQFHNARYPPGYFPRDVLSSNIARWAKEEPFDWNGDHVFTNFRSLYTRLRKEGYFVEVLGEPYTCFNASQYGTLLVVDPEEEYFAEEVETLARYVREDGLSVLVMADWYDADVMKKIVFFDDSTRQWWTPATGGSNVPALNNLLSPFGIAFGSTVYSGDFEMGDKSATFGSGCAVASFPAGGRLLEARMLDQSYEILKGGSRSVNQVPIGAVLPSVGSASGRLAVFGDSSCIDDSSNTSPSCFFLFDELLQFTSTGTLSPELARLPPLKDEYRNNAVKMPTRMEDNTLHLLSHVMDKPLPTCQALLYTEGTGQRASRARIAWQQPVYSKGTAFLQAAAGGNDAKGRSGTLNRLSAYFFPMLGVYVLVVGVILFLLWRRRERSGVPSRSMI